MNKEPIQEKCPMCNLMQVGQMFKCGHCEPDKYVTAESQGGVCTCKCHTPEPKSWEGTTKQKKYWESMKNRKGEDTPRWKGNNASKSAFHHWINKHYGNPSICENPKCKGKSKWFDWCLKTGRSYSHNIKDYLGMCRSCHRAYDLTDELKEKAIINLRKYNPFYGTERRVD